MPAGAPPAGTVRAAVPEDGVRERVLTFARPLIGLGGSTRYALRPLGRAYEPFGSLESLDGSGVRLVVVPPALVFSDYVVEVPEDDCRELGLEEPSTAAVLVVVRLHQVPVPVVNLMAPIVVHRATGAAAQVVLQDSGYGLMVPVDAPSARWRAPGGGESAPCSC
jgi:flagellar assembly factor FliW